MQIKTCFFIVYSFYKTALPIFAGWFFCASHTYPARQSLALILLNTLTSSAVSLIGCQRRCVLSILLHADKSTDQHQCDHQILAATVLLNTLPESGSALIGILSEKVLGFFTPRTQGQQYV